MPLAARETLPPVAPANAALAAAAASSLKTNKFIIYSVQKNGVRKMGDVLSGGLTL